MRSFIQHQLMPGCQVVNPGLYKTIFKKINEREKMFLRIGDDVRHIFDPRIVGKVIEIKAEKSSTMAVGGTFMDKMFALVEVATGDKHWIPYDDIMKNV